MTFAPRFDWLVRSRELKARHTVADVLSLLLRARGVADGQREAFLAPMYEGAMHDPRLLPDFSPALERILAARQRGEDVALFGDYDVDGVTASAILAQTLRRLGMRVRVMIPHRERDGYGVSVAAVCALVPPATLLLTVDNGTNARDAVAAARRRGADVIILDHHEVQGDLPEGALVVNAARGGHTYPFSKLSAAGVAYKLAAELLSACGAEQESLWLLDLAALGTLADRVPLLDENRVLAHAGLRVLREGRRPGLQALAARARVTLRACDAHAVSFQLVPRLNAAGRMRHADVALQLLLTENLQEAAELAETLEALNGERKELTERAIGDIRETLVRSVPLADILCVAGPWPAGILGILAGRFAEEIGRPAVVIGVGEENCVASVRGNGTVNMVSVVTELSALLTKFGGHAEAAGFSFPRPALQDVERFFASYVLSEAAPARASLAVDCLLPHHLVGCSVARELRVLEPHGEGNERPLFLLQDMRVEDVRAVGSKKDHQRFLLTHPTLPEGTVSGVAFRWGPRAVPARGQRLDLVAELRLDRYRGMERVDVHVRDLQTHAAERAGMRVAPPSGGVERARRGKTKNT